MAKNLVIYYSRKGENYFGGGIRSIEKGNTEYCAEYIRDALGADIFELETVKSYSDDYMKCTEEAKAELAAKGRPELKRYIESIEEYDNIFICAPCWWGTFPCAVFTQIDRLDWSGKNVFVLMTHEGSGLASSESDAKKYCKGAKVGKGLAVRGSAAKDSRAEVEAWAKKCAG